MKSLVFALLLAQDAFSIPLALDKRVDGVAVTTTTTTEFVHNTITVTTTIAAKTSTVEGLETLLPGSAFTSELTDADDALTAVGDTNMSASTTFATKTASPSKALERAPTASGALNVDGKKNIVYVTNWSVYANMQQVSDLSAGTITHVMYAFANVNPDGSLFPTDEWSDLGIKFPSDAQMSTGNNAFGLVNQLYQLKKGNRHLKVLLSIGGWTYSQQKRFNGWSATDAGRKRFASSAVEMMANWGMDGVDIDWEYPATPQEASDFTLLLKEVRQALDSYAISNGQNYHYLLTVASPADPAKVARLDVAGMNQYLDSWHVMAYDFAGAWDPTTGHQANLYMDEVNPSATKFSSQDAIAAHMHAGVPANKLVLGLPLYGRSFASTSGIGQSFQGTAVGTLEHGIFRYKELPRPGSSVYEDLSLGTSYSYDAAAKELISYDTPNVVRTKAQFILSKNLGGAMFWEAACDRIGEQSLIRTMGKALGDLDRSPNMLTYPQSSFDNIRGQ